MEISNRVYEISKLIAEYKEQQGMIVSASRTGKVKLKLDSLYGKLKEK